MARSAEKQRAGKPPAASLVAGADENGRVELPAGAAQYMADLEYVRGLIDAVDRSGIDSLEIAHAGLIRIRIAKTPAAAPPGWTTYGALSPGAPPALASVPSPALSAAPAHVEAPVEAPPKTTLVDVTSPMVGTFYRAPAPDAPPYVEPGSTVSKGQTLCILEAMKLMNELPCELDGIVREVLVEDAHPVEYGQVLFRVEPNSK